MTPRGPRVQSRAMTPALPALATGARLRAAAVAALALCLASLPAPARGQAVLATDLASGIPVGLAVPGSVAGSDEATAVSVNPAGLAFIGGATLQYFFEDGQGAGNSGNGLFAGLPIGPVVPGLSLQWMSPAGGARYLKTELALALDVGDVVALGYGWNFYGSPSPALSGFFTMDAGLVVRPGRHLSLGASALGFAGRIDGQPVPVRWAFGAAGRPLGEVLTVGLDLYATSGGGGAFGLDQGAGTVTASLPLGLAVQAQYLFPLRTGLPPARAAQAVQLAVTWNQPHAGVTVAATGVGKGAPDASAMLYGLRVSAERYPVPEVFHRVQVVDIPAALRAPPPLEALLGAPRDRYGELLAGLHRMTEDRAVAALVVDVGALPVGLGRAAELRGALLEVAGRKPVLARLGAMAGSKEYWVATAATAVYVAPGSVVAADGLASTSFFLREGLARLGVAFEAVAAGRYKSAPDALTRAREGDAQREATASRLDSQYARLVADVASARRLPEPRVRELVDVGVFSADEAKDAGLVDGALWPDEVEAEARRRAGGAPISRDQDRSARRSDRWGPRPYVALVRVDGAIAAGRSRREPLAGGAVAGADTLVDQIRRAADDSRAAAIVVRVESPGGDGFASDLVWRALVDARRKGKPVVASMGDVAASGGYLVAVAADAIVAEPTTLTGSIGVFALKPDLSGLLDKLGVNVASDQRGRNARIDSFLKPWTPEERRLVERQVQAFYAQFVARVAEGRRLPRADVERVAEGRVWTGAQALEGGLVDHLGGLEDAVALAKASAGLPAGEEVEVRGLDAPHGWPAGLAAGLSEAAGDPGPLAAALARLPEVQAAALLSEMGTVLALPVEWLDGVAGPPAP
jgi:protease-4